MPIQHRQIALNAGEWSPRLHYRSDLGKYQHAARELANFIPMVHGGIYRRPGTVYLGEVRSPGRKTRLAGYNFNTSVTYQIELGHQYMRFWRGGELVSVSTADLPTWAAAPFHAAWSGAATPYMVGDLVHNGGPGPTADPFVCWRAHTSGVANEPGVGADWWLYWNYDFTYLEGDYVVFGGLAYRCLADHISGAASEPGVGFYTLNYWVADDELILVTPYTEDEIFDVQLVSVNDIIYLVHPNHALRKITRQTENLFLIAEVTYDDKNVPPLLDENTDDSISVVPNMVEGNARVTAVGGNVFDAGHEGGYFAIRAIRSATNDLLATPRYTGGVTPARAVTTDYSVSAEAGWFGAISVERKDKGSGEWIQSKIYYGFGDRTLSVTGTPPEPNTEIRVQWYAQASNDSSGFLAFTVDESEELGYGKIVEVESATQAIVQVLKPFESTAATMQFSLGAFDDFNGHPNAATLHEQRLFLGGAANSAQRIFGSVTNDWDNFRKGANDDDAVDYVIGASEYNGIQWLMSQDQLLIGTGGGEWVVQGGGADDAITPTNILVRRVGNEGSAHIQPVAANDIVLFISRLGRKLVELVYAFEKQGYTAPDLSELAEHLTEHGIKQIAYQQQRERIVWLVTDDNRLLGVTYNREQDVVAWFQVETDGEIESVCVTYGSGSTTDNHVSYDIVSSEDAVYVVTRRLINGQRVRYVERLHPGWSSASEPGWGVEDGIYTDCSLSYAHSHAIVSISQASTGVVTVAPSIADWASTGRARFRDEVGGMVELAGMSVTARKLSTSTFALHDLDGSPIDTQGFTAYAVPILGSTGVVWQEINATSGLDHLEGEEIDLVCDGAYAGRVTVTGGAVVFPASGYSSKVSGGLPYTATVTLMPLDLALQNGTSQSRLKKIHRLAVNVLASVGFEIGHGESFDKVSFRTVDDDLGEPVPLYSGWWDDISMPGGHTKDGDVTIRQTEPLPLCIRNLVVKYSLEQED